MTSLLKNFINKLYYRLKDFKCIFLPNRYILSICTYLMHTSNYIINILFIVIHSYYPFVPYLQTSINKYVVIHFRYDKSMYNNVSIARIPEKKSGSLSGLTIEVKICAVRAVTMTRFSRFLVTEKVHIYIVYLLYIELMASVRR